MYNSDQQIHNPSHYYRFYVKIKDKAATEYKHPTTKETFIEGRVGAEYSLVFINNTHERVLVVPSVDGLCTLDGTPAGPNSRGYVVNPRGSVEIPGWTLDASKVAAFQFGESGKGKTYAEALNNAGYSVSTANQGVIGVMVFREAYTTHYFGGYIDRNGIWHTYSDKGYSPAPDSTGYYERARGISISSGVTYSLNSTSAASLSSAATLGQNSISSSLADAAMPVSASLGTQQGRDVDFKTTTTTFNRMTAPYWTGIIQYDSLDNLRKRGVIVETAFNRAFPAAACPDLR